MSFRRIFGFFICRPIWKYRDWSWAAWRT